MANFNPRISKINRSYTVEEIADLYSVHKNTVNNWLKQGLEECGAGRPRLILGTALREFLERKRRKNKRPCKPGQIYCVACRIPVFPRDNRAYLESGKNVRARVVGQCPLCCHQIHRCVSLVRKSEWIGSLVLTNTQG